MAWNSKNDRQALDHSVALLLAFASLAELAGAKPRAIRSAVLWLLRAAETIARELVVVMMEEIGGHAGLPASPHSRNVADDAMRLARAFRALAALLSGLMRCGLASPLVRTRRRLIGDRLRKLWNPGRRLPLFARIRLDTS